MCTFKVAVIGDGQLARMMAPAASELGLELRVLTSSEQSPAAQVIPGIVKGDHTDINDLRHVAQGVDVLTFEHEHVPTNHIMKLVDEGINIEPRPQALINAQDKLVMRKNLRALGAPVPPFALLENEEDAREFWQATQGKVCLKACRGGYDGHGVWFPASEDECAALVAEQTDKGNRIMGELKVDLVRELSLVLARRPSGETKAWAVTESLQTDGICSEAIAPAPNLSPELADRIREIAFIIAESLEVTGVLAVELFETRDFNGQPDVFVNELAMRPHNTGHWTQDGSVTSQFEQHLRAVSDMPLGATTLTSAFTVMANVLGAETEPDLPEVVRMQEIWKRYPAAKIHRYGKEWRAGRKLGHINLSGEDPEGTRLAARACAYFMAHGQWPEWI
ncbi:MAG: 5-(carboxyamino)imidazole ribonucleotide synthase [Corynebacterium sp.]|nr:5-(carboxyamino)imidazole ribonucleotide synthase [Corynebacterium sp.]